MRPRNDQVVNDRDLQRCADLREISGKCDVGSAGFGAMGGVVVREEQLPRAHGQGSRNDRAVPPPDAAAQPRRDFQRFQKPAVLIQQEDQQVLRLQSGKPAGDGCYRVRKSGVQAGNLAPLTQLGSGAPRLILNWCAIVPISRITSATVVGPAIKTE